MEIDGSILRIGPHECPVVNCACAAACRETEISQGSVEVSSRHCCSVAPGGICRAPRYGPEAACDVVAIAPAHRTEVVAVIVLASRNRAAFASEIAPASTHCTKIGEHNVWAKVAAAPADGGTNNAGVRPIFEVPGEDIWPG